MNEDPIARLKRLLSRLQDLTLMILKGHLLIEEQLDHFLSELSRAPAELVAARLTYSQKLHLVCAITGVKSDVLEFAKALNKVRNSLAHRADADDLPEQIVNMLRRFAPDAPARLTARQRVSWLRAQIVCVCGAINGMTDVCRALQANHGLQPTAARGIMRPPRLKPGR